MVRTKASKRLAVTAVVAGLACISIANALMLSFTPMLTSVAAIGFAFLLSFSSAAYCLIAVLSLFSVCSAAPVKMASAMISNDAFDSFVETRGMKDIISGADTAQSVIFILAECMMNLTVISAYAYRVRTLKLFQGGSEALSFSRILLHTIFVSAIVFLVSASVSALAWGMKGITMCTMAIELCLVFYLGGKVLLYIFMCERLRSIRQGIISRCADMVWQRCFFGILIIFGEIAILCFWFPVVSIKLEFCQIGLPTFITFPMLVFDVGCNIMVSVIFYRFAREHFNGFMDALIDPSIRRLFYFRIVKNQGQISFVIGRPLDQMPPQPSDANSMMAFITRKTLMVSIAILFSTIINLALLFHFNGAEHGWMCFLFCSLDITWSIICITYLIGMPTQHEVYSKEDFFNRQEHFEQLKTESPHGHFVSGIELNQVSSYDNDVADPSSRSAELIQRLQLSPPQDFHSTFNSEYHNSSSVGLRPLNLGNSSNKTLAGLSNQSCQNYGRHTDTPTGYDGARCVGRQDHGYGNTAYQESTPENFDHSVAANPHDGF